MTERNIELEDKMIAVVVKLTAVSDFIERIGDKSYILQENTPPGLHLIMSECIKELKAIGGIV